MAADDWTMKTGPFLDESDSHSKVKDSERHDDVPNDRGPTERHDDVPNDRGPTESSSSDSEEESSSAGYVLLPQDEGEELQTDWSLGGEEFTQPSVGETGSSETAGAVGMSQPLSGIEDSEVEVIKQAMAGFTLPPSVMPEWAKVVPEDVWKAELIGGLKKKKQKRK